MGKVWPEPSRRAFIVAVAAASTTVISPWNASAAVIKPPQPAPQFTTTSNAPHLISAHCGVFDNTMQVSVQASEPSSIKVQAWAIDDPSQTFESPWVPTIVGTDPTNPINFAKFWMPDGTGAPGRAWAWQVSTALLGTAPDAPIDQSYATDTVIRKIPRIPAPDEATAFSFAVGSCSQIAQLNQANRPIASVASIARAATQDLNPPVFFVHLGDTSYVDTWKTVAQDTDALLYTKFGTGFARHCAQPDFSYLYQLIPMAVVFDDHEDGTDNCSWITVYVQARQVLSDLAAGTSFNNAGYDPINPVSPSYRTWKNGLAQFFLTDNRLWRDDPTTKPQSYKNQPYASQLGKTQRDWLKAGLGASTSPVNIVFLPRAFKEFYGGPEQQELLDFIAANVKGTVIILTGDMHAAAAWQLGPNTYELLCGPMFNTTLHTPTKLNKTQIKMGYQELFFNTPTGLPGVRAKGNAWGRVDVGADGSVTFNAMDELGSVLYSRYVPPRLIAA